MLHRRDGRSTILEVSGLFSGGLVAKTKRSRSSVLTAAAEAVGATLGRVIGTIDRLHADHPHPGTEAQQALADVRQTRSGAAAEAAETARLAASEGRTTARRVGRRAAVAKRRITKAVTRRKGSKKR
jgi:hypothetical protein